VKAIVKGSYNPLKVERAVIEFWQIEKIPSKVREWSRRQERIFTFLEGPPTTNGFMHVGHARGRTMKDIVLRFMRMQGYNVWDQAGWDTQGLPVELEVEKKLGFKSKKDIEVYGIEAFVRECQKLVDYYLSHWRKDSERLGLWLDYEHAYETRTPRYLDALWTFLKEMWNKGLLYEDLRVIPVCPRCETALSGHEVALGSKVVKDPSLFFKVPLLNQEKTYMVAWTTTPWTIISNEALAVHPDEYYVKIEVNGEYWIVAEKRLEYFAKEVKLEKYKVVDRFPGKDLKGFKYKHPLLEEVPKHNEHNGEWEHAIITADWVSMEEGTGVVHMAPAHGPEDFEVAKEYGIRVFKPLMKNGFFSEEAGKYAGLWFKDADKQVIEDLKRKNLLVYCGLYEHEYPHCWRCDTPLMYYADTQWFIKIETIKGTMLQENSKVEWYPPWAGKRFSDWIENARDWCISRERYWGTPLPIWTCRKCKHRIAVGSLEELKKLAVNPEDVIDHHRPWVDRVKIKCPKCGDIMEREKFVVDVWMDSGMAHTAALHQYGWDELFDKFFPYDFITEAVDQTRGWFYTLMFTSVALYGKSPYKKVLNQGHVLDKYGKKMSKSKGNVIWAAEAMGKWGADVLRFYLMAKASPWDNVNFDPAEIRVYKRTLDILWNSVNFALTYMELDKWSPIKLEENLKTLRIEDKWLLTELHKTLEEVKNHLSKFDIHKAVRAISDFIMEKLSHKYITLIRPRVWIERDDPVKRSAYAVLYIALDSAIKAIAPITPFLAEYLYQAFTRRLNPEAPISVHMTLWPKVPRELIFEKAWERADKVLKVAEEILSLRMKIGVKRRWPLKRSIIVCDQIDNELRESTDLLKVYANIKTVDCQTQPVEGEFEIVEADGLKVYVDTKVDEEVLLEGLARELVRRIQVMRKDLNLPLDAILKEVLVYTKDENIIKAVKRHEKYILSEVRAEAIRIVKTEPEDAKAWTIEGAKVKIKIKPTP